MIPGNIFQPLTKTQRITKPLAAGLCTIEYVPVDWILYLPEINPLYNTITEKVRLKEGKVWLSLPAPDRDRALEESHRDSDAGTYLESVVSAILPFDSATNAVCLNVMRYFRYLVVVKLPGGLRKLLGSIENPVLFARDFNSGNNDADDSGSTLSFSWTSEAGSIVYMGIPSDDEIFNQPPVFLLGDGSGHALADESGMPISA